VSAGFGDVLVALAEAQQRTAERLGAPLAPRKCGAAHLMPDGWVRWCQIEHGHGGPICGAMYNGSWSTWPRS